MRIQNWIDWAQKQLADLSTRLFRQGYHPAKIEYLNETSTDFRDQFRYYLSRINSVMEEMAANPEGYHHFDDFSQAKAALLEFTNYNREQYLELGLRQTA